MCKIEFSFKGSRKLHTVDIAADSVQALLSSLSRDKKLADLVLVNVNGDRVSYLTRSVRS